ncbi:MAG: cell division protein ZapA [Sphingomonadaceae bacterium]
MAEVVAKVGGRSYRLLCGDGEEAALRAAAAYLNEKAVALSDSLGAVSEGRLLLMSALIVVAELNEARAKTQSAATAPVPDDGALESLIARVEALAEGLENAAQTP